MISTTTSRSETHHRSFTSFRPRALGGTVRRGVAAPDAPGDRVGVAIRVREGIHRRSDFAPAAGSFFRGSGRRCALRGVEAVEAEGAGKPASPVGFR